MSKEKSPRLNRKRRLLIFAIITAIGVTVALYNSLNSFDYGHTKQWNFDSYPVGAVPSDFTVYESGSTPGLWAIQANSTSPSNNMLVTMPQGNTTGYHIQIMPDSPVVSDAQVSVKFMILPGHSVEQAGLVIRFIDSSHYFVLMADPQNNRISLCKADIQFVVCNYETHMQVNTGQWYTLGVTVSSEGIGGWLDGIEVIKANNEYYQTGQVGLWTKDDTAADFDDLKMKY